MWFLPSRSPVGEAHHSSGPSQDSLSTLLEQWPPSFVACSQQSLESPASTPTQVCHQSSFLILHLLDNIKFRRRAGRPPRGKFLAFGPHGHRRWSHGLIAYAPLFNLLDKAERKAPMCWTMTGQQSHGFTQGPSVSTSSTPPLLFNNFALSSNLANHQGRLTGFQDVDLSSARQRI